MVAQHVRADAEELAMAAMTTIDPPGLFRSPRYAHIVAGGFAFIAGQTAFDEQGNVVGVGDIGAQCERTLRNLEICLRAVNATPQDIVKVTNYVTDRAYLAVLVETRDRIFGELRTSSTAVVAGLARDTLLVEVDAIVALG
jgi:enamine deaminase RidA (YjgF/YER057c/UK114 family)